MNIQQNISKLITAIKYKGKKIKYETRLFYNDEKENYTTLIIFYERQPKYDIETREIIGEKWESIFTGYSKVDFMKFLANYYKEVIDNETI